MEAVHVRVRVGEGQGNMRHQTNKRRELSQVVGCSRYSYDVILEKATDEYFAPLWHLVTSLCGFASMVWRARVQYSTSCTRKTEILDKILRTRCGNGPARARKGSNAQIAYVEHPSLSIFSIEQLPCSVRHRFRPSLRDMDTCRHGACKL